MLHDPAHDLPPEIDLVGVPEVGKVRGRVPHDLEPRPQVATPEPLQQSVQSTEVHPERDRRLQVDQVEEPVDADLSDGPRRQAPDEGQVHGHVCMMMMMMMKGLILGHRNWGYLRCIGRYRGYSP